MAERARQADAVVCVDATGCGDYRRVRKTERVSADRCRIARRRRAAQPGRRAVEPRRALRRGRAAGDGCGRGARALADRLPDLRHAERRAIERRPVCHALTGDQHVANVHPVTGKPGWWETMVGPGRPIDTDRFFVICANVIGGCMGTTGPASHEPGDRPALCARLPGRHHPRHGAGAGHAPRPPRHREPVLRRRRLDGRHAGAAMGGELSRAGLRRPADRRRRRATRRRTSPSTRSAARP